MLVKTFAVEISENIIYRVSLKVAKGRNTYPYHLRKLRKSRIFFQIELRL